MKLIYFWKNILFFLLLGLIPNVEIKKNINEYKESLYKNGIGENNDDIKQGNSIPLEYNLVFLNGGKIKEWKNICEKHLINYLNVFQVTFDKGCYLGQELVAKTHHTGVIRKRIMPIKLLER